jgi:hypothetical protein
MSEISLSKSQFTRGLQCHKSLWLLKDGTIKPKTPSETLQTIFDEGTRVGEEAQKLFPGGKGIRFKGSTFDERIELTRKYIASGVSTIYEATFNFDDIWVMVDILHQGENGWEIYEVKSASDVYRKKEAGGVKNVYLNDLAIQYYVLKGSGLDILSASLIHINSKYVRDGTLEIDQLFSVFDLTETVVDSQIDISEQLSKIRKALNDDQPKIEIGTHCNKPYQCDFKNHCWPDEILKGYSVFNISGLKVSKKFELYASGILEVKDTPNNFLHTDNQKLQVEVEKTGNTIIDQRGINKFLEQLYYPLYFLDFETFQQTIPEWDCVSPYQQIPFQYSIHYIEEDGGELFHLEFLATEGFDPRKSLAEKLVQDIPREVCVLAYNCGFEKSVIQKLAELYPEHSEHLMDIHDNALDLMIPFQKKHYYTREMQGSYSLKKVLPALVPDSSYEGMEIADGRQASSQYIELGSIDNIDKKETIKSDLLKYCKQDTHSMVDVLECLKKVVI